MAISKIKLAIRADLLSGVDRQSLAFDAIVIVDAIDDSTTVSSVICPKGFGDVDATDAFRRSLDLAVVSKSAIVEVPDAGQVKRATGVSPLRIGDWLTMVADEAAARGVMIAVVNGSAVRTATMMWSLLERVNHPAVGCAWDARAAARWGETPGVSVPTLGTRIVTARVGSVDDRTRKLILRLRGVGFGGWLTISDASIVNEAAIATIRKWIAPPAPAKPAPKPPVKPRGVVA